MLLFEHCQSRKGVLLKYMGISGIYCPIQTGVEVTAERTIVCNLQVYAALALGVAFVSDQHRRAFR
jgi:hypothetical protein